MGVDVELFVASRAADKVGSLVVEEEEEVVLDGRAADLTAELVAPIDVGISAFRIDPVTRVEIAVAHELEKSAVPLV